MIQHQSKSLFCSVWAGCCWVESKGFVTGSFSSSQFAMPLNNREYVFSYLQTRWAWALILKLFLSPCESLLPVNSLGHLETGNKSSFLSESLLLYHLSTFSGPKAPAKSHVKRFPQWGINTFSYSESLPSFPFFFSALYAFYNLHHLLSGKKSHLWCQQVYKLEAYLHTSAFLVKV